VADPEEAMHGERGYNPITPPPYPNALTWKVKHILLFDEGIFFCLGRVKKNTCFTSPPASFFRDSESEFLFPYFQA
jgi:hypothetical protein